MNELDWPSVVVGALGLCAAGTRLLGKCRNHRRLLLIVAEVIERLAGAPGAKRSIETETAKAPAAVRALAEAAAAKAEASTGQTGTSMQTRQETRGRRVVREVLRWLPVVGAFL